LPFNKVIFINKKLKIIIIYYINDLIIIGPNKDKITKITKITIKIFIKLKLEYCRI